MRNSFLILIFTGISLFSCRDNNSNSYAINDFRKPLQDGLNKVVSKGVVGWDDGTLEEKFKDGELIKLTKSDNPILRSYAYRCIFKRNTFDHYKLVIEHLDDTALIPVDFGEFGIMWRTVSEDLVLEVDWKTEAAKQKAIGIILSKHNYLRCAYKILESIEPNKAYYKYIRAMAVKPIRISEQGYEGGFYDRESALYGLAKFRKKEDIPLIKKNLDDNAYSLSRMSFKLMEEFPDSSYMDIFQKFHDGQFYRWEDLNGDWSNNITGYYKVRVEPETFIDALIAQKNVRSAVLLDTMLRRLPREKYFLYNDHYFDMIVLGISISNCAAYEGLRQRTKSRAEFLRKGRGTLPPYEGPSFVDTSPREVKWGYY